MRDYSFGYQGSESETSFNSGIYLTHFRLLDSRLGRWMSVDPKYDFGIYYSTFCAMGNNPIVNNDVLGDWFGKATERKISRLEKKIDKRIGEIDNEINRIKSQLEIDEHLKELNRDFSDLDHDQEQEKISNLENEKKSLQDAKLEIADLRNDETKEYRIKISIFRNIINQRGGYIEQPYKQKGNLVMVHMGLRSRASTRIHELKHCHQTFTGELSHYPASNSRKTYDIYDEVDAYQRQFAFAPNDVRAGFSRVLGITITTMDDITPENVKQLDPSSYGELKEERLFLPPPTGNKRKKK